MVGKITTTGIGGGSNEILAGIETSVIRIREYVNNVETTDSNALSGTILAESETGTIINVNNPYNNDPNFPETQFIFTPIELITGQQYVVEWVVGSGAAVYVSTVDGLYDGGQAYDINGSNIGLSRDSPMGVWKVVPVVPEGSTCETAIVIAAGTYENTGIPAGSGTTEPEMGSATGAAWYSYTPETDLTLTISSEISVANGGSNDTRVHLYSGECGALSHIVSNNDGGANATSVITHNVDADTTYLIAWDNGLESIPFTWELSESPI